MLHPDTELRFVNDRIGYGVFATRLIPRGTLTWVRDRFDQSFTRDQARQLSSTHQQILYRYAYLDRQDRIVLCWDLARFINHSCRPACLTTAFDAEIAIRDIAPGDEITDDYSLLNLGNSFACSCGQTDCRGEIRPDDSARLGPLWNSQLWGAFGLLELVPQPLWEFLSEPQRVLRAARDPAASALW